MKTAPGCNQDNYQVHLNFFLLLGITLLCCHCPASEDYCFICICPLFQLIFSSKINWEPVIHVIGSVGICAGKILITPLSQAKVVELTSCHTGLSHECKSPSFNFLFFTGAHVYGTITFLKDLLLSQNFLCQCLSSNENQLIIPHWSPLVSVQLLLFSADSWLIICLDQILIFRTVSVNTVPDLVALLCQLFLHQALIEIKALENVRIDESKCYD